MSFMIIQPDKKEKVKQTKSLYNPFSSERDTVSMYSSSRVKVVYQSKGVQGNTTINIH